jgi:uncharacterized protein
VNPTQISENECRRLLADHQVGRLAVVVGGQPAIFPVNYVFAQERIVFRTHEGVLLHHATRRRVAFEIDGIDEAKRVGWSVLVKGSAYEITRTDDPLSEELRRLPLSPFAPGDKPHWLEIVPVEITGRRLEG